MKSFIVFVIFGIGVVVSALLFGGDFSDRANLEARVVELEKKLEMLSIGDGGIVSTVDQIKDGVVSIVATKDLVLYRQMPFYHPFFDEFFFRDPFFSFGRPQVTEERFADIEVGAGSGFIFDEEGYVITNAHVVRDRDARYTVVMYDGTEVSAEVVFRHPYQDVAVVQINPNDIQGNLRVLQLGDSDTLHLGEQVIAVGNALSEFQNTVTAGVISGFGRNLERSWGGDPSLYNLLQTDAAINPGNSGGPLLNLRGEVIGINTAIAAGADGIGFALPINDVKASFEEFLE